MGKFNSKLIKKLALQQNVSLACIYSRINRGWSEGEVERGYRINCNPYKKEPSTRYDLSCGQTSFLVLLFDVIKCVTKLNDLDNYPLTVAVFYGLLGRKTV